MFNFINKKMSELSITGLLTLGKYSEALSLIDQLLASDKNNPLLLYQKGFCHYNIKKYKEAIESLEKAIEQKKDYRDAFIYLAKSELAMRDYLKSAEHYQIAHNIKGLNRKETISYVKALMKLGKNNQALEFIENNNLINLLDIIDIEIQKIKIDLFLKIGKPKEALYIIEKLEPINIQKDITLDIYKADALLSANRLEEATFLIEKIQKNLPRSGYVKSLYSRLIIEQGKYEEALQIVADALKSTPRDEKLHYLNIELLIKLKKYKEALISIEGISNIISKTAYLNYKSILFLEMENIEKASEYNAKSLIEEPNSSIAHTIKADIIYRQFIKDKEQSQIDENKLAEAIDLLGKAFTLTKDIKEIEQIDNLKTKIEKEITKM